MFEIKLLFLFLKKTNLYQIIILDVGQCKHLWISGKEEKQDLKYDFHFLWI